MRKWIQNTFARFRTGIFHETLLYGLPFAVWLFAFRSFYSSEKGLTLLSDANRAFISLNYYLNNLLRGSYPFWCPFNAWGRPDDFAVRIIGEFNPFYYFIPLLRLFGVPLSLAFFLFIVGYFFFGVMGFYRLAKEIFEEKFLAYAAMVMLLFSSIGTNIFNDLLVILILVPSIWFFYFLVSFAKEPRTFSLVGLTFCTMLLAVTYIPYIFVTIAVTVFLFLFLFFPRKVFERLKTCGSFCWQKKLLVLLCVFSVVAALVPGLLYSQASHSGDYVASWRDPGAENADTISLSLENIYRGGGIIGSLSWERLVSELDIIPHLGFIYVPFFWILMAAVGTFLPLTRRLWLYFCVSLVFISVSLGGVFPVHKFLFEHVFFIRAFRNLHFFVWFAMISGILFLLEQFRLYVSLSEKSRTPRIIAFIFISLIHAGAFIFVLSRPHVIFSLYGVIALSYALFTSILWIKNAKSSRLIPWLLFILLSLQAFQVYQTIVYNSRKSKSNYTANPYSFEESKPQFSFQRPLVNEKVERKRTEDFGEVSDTSGFIPPDIYYLGLKWSYDLHQQIPPDILANYVKDKFVLYDTVEYVEPKKTNIYKFQKNLSQNLNMALVEGKAPESKTESHEGKTEETPQVITEETQGFKVLHFDINGIKFQTDFPTRKFLVYNDSYHPDWFAWMNGAKVPVYKANIAFKGLWLPAGQNTVSLRFRPFWRYLMTYMLLILFLGYLLYLMITAFRQVLLKKSNNDKDN